MKRTARKPSSSISKGRSYEEIGEYWDTHELPSSVMGGKPVDLSVNIRQRWFLVAIEPSLFAKVRPLQRFAGEPQSAGSARSVSSTNGCRRSARPVADSGRFCFRFIPS